MKRFSSLLPIVVTVVVVVVVHVTGQTELRLKPFGESFTKPLSASIVFTCEVVGEVRDGVNYNIRWYNNLDQEIKEKTGRLYVEEDRSTMKKLYITNIEEKDKGKYKCAALIDGQERQKVVTLNLFKEITFDHAPSPQHPAINTDHLIECRVSGNPEPTVSWRYRGERIVFGGRHTKEENGIRIKNITREDDGEYICRAEVEAAGRYSERKISVIVHIPPTITRGPGNLEGVEGDDIIMTCKSDGLPQPKFQFEKDGNPTPLYSTSRIQVDSDGGSIAFRPLNKSDEGKYICRVNNDVGSDFEDGFLKVLVKPVIHDFKNVVLNEGEKLTWDCLSYGDPAPEMTFRKAGQTTDYITGSNEDERVIVKSFEGKLQMIIESVITDDMSNYTCRSSNRIGSNKHMASLAVKFRPRFPVNHTKTVYIWAGKTKNITCHILSYPEPSSVVWLRNNIPLSNNDTYRIYNMGGQSSLLVKVRETDQGWIYGNYTCQASNDLGTSNIVIELKRANVPSKPESVNVTELMPNSVIIHVVPPEENGGEDITGYRVECEEVTLDFPRVNINDSRSTGAEPVYSTNPTALDVEGSKIMIENLKSSTNYVLRVRAKNGVGVGNHLEHSFKTLPIRRPYPIRIISLSNGGAFNYNIEWEKPHTGGLPIKEYEFQFRKVKLVSRIEGGSEEEWQLRTVLDDPTHPMVNYMLDNLVPDSTYQLVVRVRNDIGWSEPSIQFEFSTRQPTESELLARASSSLGVVVGVVIFICVLILLAVDLGCYFVNGCGVTKTVCVHVCGEKKQHGDSKAMEQGESIKALHGNDKEAATSIQKKSDIASEQMLKDGVPGGKNDSGDDTKEEITLHENDKLMENKD